MGGGIGSDFEAIHTGYYCRGTILEVIQNQEGVSQKIREIIWRRTKKDDGGVYKIDFIPTKILFKVDNWLGYKEEEGEFNTKFT